MVGIFIVVFLLCVSFALYTNHAWEDWYITYRASKNLAMGNGLVYTPGERLHTFTSPLGALIPAFIAFVTSNSSDDLVLWLYRMFCCCLHALSALVLLRFAQHTEIYRISAAFMVGLFAVDARIVDFSINGMETALMMFFLAYSIYVLSLTPRNFIWQLGLAWAGLMWTRPDSFVYIGGLAFGFLLFKPASPEYCNHGSISSLDIMGLELLWHAGSAHYYRKGAPESKAWSR
jgi:hypothetical protein